MYWNYYTEFFKWSFSIIKESCRSQSGWGQYYIEFCWCWKNLSSVKLMLKQSIVNYSQIYSLIWIFLYEKEIFCRILAFVNCDHISFQTYSVPDGIQQNAFLTHDKLVDYEELLLEEMEPTAIADILYCHAVLSSDEHDAIDKMSNRRDKAKKLITKIGQQPDKIPVLCHALEQSKCSRAVEYIRNKTSNGPSYSSGE